MALCGATPNTTQTGRQTHTDRQTDRGGVCTHNGAAANCTESHGVRINFWQQLACSASGCAFSGVEFDATIASVLAAATDSFVGVAGSELSPGWPPPLASLRQRHWDGSSSKREKQGNVRNSAGVIVRFVSIAVTTTAEQQ